MMSKVWYLHVIQRENSQERRHDQIMNFCKRSYQAILRYLYTEVIKHRGEISLHKHFEIPIIPQIL